MNLILTLNCNNHCPYCFQNNLIENKQQEFILKNLEKVLKWAQLSSKHIINILGGEPTLYSQFIEAIQLIKQYYPNNNFCIITNLLGKQQYIDFLLNEITINKHCFILINTSIDNDKQDLFNDRLKQFNYINYNNNISLSITLTQNKQLNQKYIYNIINLLNKYSNINLLRIGLELPGAKHKQIMYQYDNDLINLIDNLHSNIQIVPDCNYPICLCSLKIQEQYNNRLYRSIQRTGCKNPPVDILPNLKAKYCFSSSKKYEISNIFNYINYYSLEQLLYKFEQLYIPQSQKCQYCQYFLNGQCWPCHSIDEMWIENNLDKISNI